MGREVKRVPADFDWPYRGKGKTWQGYIMPDELHPDQCAACDGSGLNQETKRLSDDWYDHEGFVIVGTNFPDQVTDEQILAMVKMSGGTHTYRYGQDPQGKPAEWSPWKVIGTTKCWQHNITQDEVNALVAHHRLIDFTHVWKGGDEGWVRREDGYTPTAEEVNVWSHCGMGHDAINHSICVEARAKRLGVYGYCEVCKGEGRLWQSEEQRQQHENWNKTDPPTGPAYQIWETVSEGSPVSPPFLKPEDLARWMVENDESITKNTTFEQWVVFITECCWAPSSIIHQSAEGSIVQDGVSATVEAHNQK